MPIHDWTRVNAGLFHHFHQRWISAISDTLNAGLLPERYYALTEQPAGGCIRTRPRSRPGRGRWDERRREARPSR